MRSSSTRRALGAGGQRQQRRPDVVALDQAHREQRGLGRHRVGRALEVGAEQGQPAGVEAPGLVPVAGARRAATAPPSRPGPRCSATETTPSPPIASTASVAASSPASTATSRGRSRQITASCSMLPLASLTAITRGCSASRRNVSASTLVARPARARCRRRSAGRPRRRWPGSGRRASAGRAGCSTASTTSAASAPRAAARRVASIEARVSLVPVPATTSGAPGRGAGRRGGDGDLDEPVALGGRTGWAPRRSCRRGRGRRSRPGPATRRARGRRPRRRRRRR